MISLETSRTFLRQLGPNDAEDFFNLNLDPEVIIYTGDKPFRNISEAEVFLKYYDQYAKYNVGRLAVINKSNNEFIGWCGLKYSEDIKEYDIGFRFFKNFWNQGYATETAMACLKYGFEEIHLPEILGRAQVENFASIRVLEKLGLKYSGLTTCGGESAVIYSITSEMWSQSPIC